MSIALILSLSLSVSALAGEEGTEKTRKKKSTEVELHDVAIDARLVEIVRHNIGDRVEEVSNDDIEQALRALDENESEVLEVSEIEDAFITIGDERFRCPEALFLR